MSEINWWKSRICSPYALCAIIQSFVSSGKLNDLWIILWKSIIWDVKSRKFFCFTYESIRQTIFNFTSLKVISGVYITSFVLGSLTHRGEQNLLPFWISKRKAWISFLYPKIIMITPHGYNSTLYIDSQNLYLIWCSLIGFLEVL